jgi:hypothetical protein
MNIRSFTFGLMAGSALGALATAAIADPPTRVGRIAYVEGEVSLQPPQENFWTDASQNYPVASGEAFWTGDEGRAELEVGSAEFWLDNQTELDVVDLDYGRSRLSLAQGSMEVRLRRAPRGGVEIATPAGDVNLSQAGQYRIDVAAPPEDGSYPQVEVTTFDGEAGVPSRDGQVAVDAGESALIDPGADPYAVDVQDAAIDDWAQDREASERWADWNGDAPAMTGYEDLGRYGAFVDNDQYGQVWFPSDVPDDWAPYRYGHWASVQPWGWTWIDDQPWGFAPFHYGRWARIDGRWGWVRGQREPEPAYAPALVAFFGGGGWNLGYGQGGALGWAPLAPDEAYRPSYQVSDDYLRRLNSANVRQSTINALAYAPRQNSLNTYRNASAAVVVGANAFSQGAPVQRAVLPVAPQTLASAPPSVAFRPPAAGPQARAGGLPRPTSEGPRARQPMMAAAPPINLRAVRQGLIAQQPGALRPPVIAGAQLEPRQQAPRPRGFIAPSQLRNPGAQARVAPPVVRGAPNPPAPGGQAFRPLRPAPGVGAQAPFQAQEQEQMRLQQQRAAQAARAREQQQLQSQQQEQMRSQQQAAQAQAAERARQQQEFRTQQQEQMRGQQQAAQAQAAARAQQGQQMRMQQQQAAQAQAAARAQQGQQVRMQQQQAAQARARQEEERKRKQPPPDEKGQPPQH